MSHHLALGLFLIGAAFMAMGIALVIDTGERAGRDE